MVDTAKIKSSLLTLYPFSEEQIRLFTEKLKYIQLKRKEFLLQPKFISQSLTFINSGSFRFYTKTEDADLTFYFFTELNWVADIESLLLQKPSRNYIEAAENSELLSIGLQDFHFLMDADPCFRMLNALMANITISASHIVTINTKSPDKRYKELITKHPDWINRFPQNHIASYLGMTRETLSRVRARMS